MMDNETLIMSCLPTVKGLLYSKGKHDIAYILKEENLQVNFYRHDNWNGGIDFYNIEISVSTDNYVDIQELGYEEEIVRCFNASLGDVECIVVENVTFKPSVSIENSNLYYSSSDLWFEVVRVGEVKINGKFMPNIEKINKLQHYPSYVLCSSEWNDYFTFKTSFYLVLCRSDEEKIFIGNLKIMNDKNDDTFRNCLNLIQN